MNGISELIHYAIERKEFRNLKDDVLKLIGNSRICDAKRKGRKKDNNKEKDSEDSKNVNNNNNDNDNLIDKLLNNKDKWHNFSDKVLNSLTNIAKLKEKILIKKKGRRNKYTSKGYKIKTW